MRLISKFSFVFQLTFLILQERHPRELVELGAFAADNPLRQIAATVVWQ